MSGIHGGLPAGVGQNSSQNRPNGSRLGLSGQDVASMFGAPKATTDPSEAARLGNAAAQGTSPSSSNMKWLLIGGAVVAAWYLMQ